ncbi:MAG: HNH endonuclease [Chloroflexi bacterium]|nr:HNH endonuclease [Chloroflexota bacterium]
MAPSNSLGGPPVCELCKRESPRFTSHHLVPRSRGGRLGPQARLCPTCHRQLHAMFSEATLAKELNSIETLRANIEVANYLRWARHQKGPTSFPVRRAKNRR